MLRASVACSLRCMPDGAVRTDVVGVHNAHYMFELLCKAPAVVEPSQVLWLLQDCHVRLGMQHMLVYS